MNRKERNRLGLKLLAYYVVLIGVVGVSVWQYPDILPLLPFGGLEALQERTDLVTETDLATLITHVNVPLDLAADSINITFSMLGALLLMIPVRWLYLAVGDLETAEKLPSGHKVSASLLLLPLVVTAVISIVKFSLALAFALTGIFAAVRYRTTLKNLTDALFIFACMAIGLAAGTQTLGIALALSFFFVYTALWLEPLVESLSEDPKDEETQATK